MTEGEAPTCAVCGSYLEPPSGIGHAAGNWECTGENCDRVVSHAVLFPDR